MKRPLRIAEFKAKLSECLREVRRGRELTVYDRDQPIARVIPISHAGRLSVTEPTARYASLGDIPLPPQLGNERDVVELLIDERRPDR